MNNKKAVLIRDGEPLCSMDKCLADEGLHMDPLGDHKGIAIVIGIEKSRLTLMGKPHAKIICILPPQDFIPSNIQVLYDMGACYVASNGEDISDVIRHIKERGTSGRDISHFKSITSLYKKYLQEVENKFLQSTLPAQ